MSVSVLSDVSCLLNPRREDLGCKFPKVGTAWTEQQPSSSLTGTLNWNTQGCIPTDTKVDKGSHVPLLTCRDAKSASELVHAVEGAPEDHSVYSLKGRRVSPV